FHCASVYGYISDLSNVTGSDQEIRLRERRMVEGIRGVSAEIESDPFSDRKCLLKRHVYLTQSRAIQDVPSHIAEGSGSGSSQRTHIEPGVDRRILEIGITDDIRIPLVVRCQAVTIIRSHVRREGI